ncbi:YcaO-like family protein [Canibacter sp. lx-45]|uniref:YcaO-like family protein n=1 Tax=Canibacter zhuwentaonis TaxID=2837491 RepID=UPI001BDD19B3|nr:YcaO-like family protein [Canibacter zhuwentaonis]MBT1035949.1 YcaO-like family protein [Canibacter zhuwentaonis]
MPALATGVSLRALQDMLPHVSPLYGPILRASTFFGSGESAGGGYAGHAELFDIDGLLRDIYGQPSMEAGVNDTLFGGGKGFKLSNVTLSTIGESLERVVAGLISTATDMPSVRRLGSFQDLSSAGFPCLPPSKISLFSDWQYRQPHFLYEQFTEETPVQWICGRRLYSGEEVWVPAQLVDMIHVYDPGESVIGYSVSGGLSCHTSFKDAVYHGLTEVIERDAVNISWYTDQPPELVKIDDTVRSVLGGFAERLELDHSGGFLLRHHSDVCSANTFSVIGFQEWLPRRQYCAGGGCDFSGVTAMRKAAAEYGQTRSTLSLANMAPGSSVGRSVRQMFDWDYDRHLSEMTLFFQAIGYYGLPDNVHHLDHYLRSNWISGDVAIGDIERNNLSTDESLEQLTAELLESDIDPIILDYSHPDWSSLSVVKVFVPELTTPFLQSRPMLGHPRLAQLRSELIQSNNQVLPLPYP